MKIKKLLSAIVLILAVIAVLFVAILCNLMHKHVFTEWETVSEPTCTAFGLEKRSCDCGYVEYGTKGALAHTPVTDAAVGASCTAPGKTEGSHCKGCGAVITKQTETDKLAHSFSEWETVSEPTCTALGLEKRSCDCGHTEYNTVAVLSHTPVTDAAVGATCTTPGKTEGSHCSACGTIITAQSEIAPTGHSCDEITVLEEAMCNLDGTKRFSCTNFGCSYYYDESYSLPELDGSEIYANAVQYTGFIRIFGHLGEITGETSAFVISADGKIVTSNFKLDNAFSAIFILGENEYDVTEVLAYSEKVGIAVVKVDATDLPYANLCRRDPVDAETVYTVGAPGGLADSISRGVVSNANRVIGELNYIQHDADIYKGSGGSPLINRYGEVIGINTSVISEEGLSAAVRISEIDSLDYSSPMSMAEYGNLTYTPAEQLNDWVNMFYNATTDNAKAYAVEGNGFHYAFGYDTQKLYSFAEGYWVKEGNYQLNVRIIFDNSNGTYQYYATLTDGMKQNEAYGFIEAETYTKSTVITYDTFYGRYWTESELMALYSTAVYDTLGWFSYCLDTYFDTLTLETFGFTSLSYDKDEDALDKLNGFVEEAGTLDQATGSHVLTNSNQVNSDVAYFEIVYTPVSEQAPASTVVSMYYYKEDGSLYTVSINLNPAENGNRFEVSYAVYNGTEYAVQNVGWGYLDAGSLTNKSKPTCYEFNGMNEYEDGLLTDYVSYISQMMGWLNNVMAGIEPTLSIKDLGFFIYFG